MHLRLLLILAFLFAMPAIAAYKWTMPDGSVIFSDQPPHPDAEKITLLPTQTFSAPPIPKQAVEIKPDAETRDIATYSSLQIAQPANEATIRDNSGNITVSVSSEPPLFIKKGHQITLLLDGVTISTSTSAQTMLPNIDRGSHTLRATIIDKEGTALITSNDSIFYLHRVSILH
ncbi:MAG: DUF4124 domain-containing protein [Gammaproteobacteria bacterium]|nr:DUF4124 domain-containing protein [Gammaproteobacteria bacterium]